MLCTCQVFVCNGMADSSCCFCSTCVRNDLNARCCSDNVGCASASTMSQCVICLGVQALCVAYAIMQAKVACFAELATLQSMLHNEQTLLRQGQHGVPRKAHQISPHHSASLPLAPCTRYHLQPARVRR